MRQRSGFAIHLPIGPRRGLPDRPAMPEACCLNLPGIRLRFDSDAPRQGELAALYAALDGCLRLGTGP